MKSLINTMFFQLEGGATNWTICIFQLEGVGKMKKVSKINRFRSNSWFSYCIQRLSASMKGEKTDFDYFVALMPIGFMGIGYFKWEWWSDSYIWVNKSVLKLNNNVDFIYIIDASMKPMISTLFTSIRRKLWIF